MRIETIPPAAPAIVSVAVVRPNLGGDVEAMASGIGIGCESLEDIASWYKRPRIVSQKRYPVSLIH